MRGITFNMKSHVKTFALKGIFLLLIYTTALNLHAEVAPRYRAIDSLVREGFMNASFVSLGGHQGNCVEASLENKTGNWIYVWIEAGRRLIAGDSTKQDIFVVKDNKVKIGPWAQIKTMVFGFCCQSSDGSPKAKMKFDIGFMAPPEWVRLAKFINASNFDHSSIQTAVWCLSNDHSISSIYGEPAALVKALRDTLGAIKKIPVPWYTTSYESSAERVFSGNPERVTGKFNYYIKHHGDIIVAIKDKHGLTVKVLSEYVNHGEGSFEYQLDLYVKGWTRGEYHVVVYEDGATVLASKSFKIE